MVVQMLKTIWAWILSDSPCHELSSMMDMFYEKGVQDERRRILKIIDRCVEIHQSQIAKNVTDEINSE